MVSFVNQIASQQDSIMGGSCELFQNFQKSWFLEHLPVNAGLEKLGLYSWTALVLAFFLLFKSSMLSSN